MDVEKPEVFLALVRKLMRARLEEKGWTEADVAYVVGDAE